MEKADDKMPPTVKAGGARASREGWLIAMQLLDTTWRVALPILLFSYIGIRLDKHYDSEPLYTLISFFLSLAFATLLVYRQIKNLYPSFFKGSKK